MATVGCFVFGLSFVEALAVAVVSTFAAPFSCDTGLVWPDDTAVISSLLFVENSFPYKRRHVVRARSVSRRHALRRTRPLDALAARAGM